ncbi:hypothetical protein [uncultured Adlercreutzia sp.]|uniref:hypothetical protein n=1 Tax=uncultured Adlercreutzia sp. TaxID=875803 RepID=UPI0025CCC24C|nr:hypothetical protein [uncultured Adlercreutzia sp.]
MELVLFGINPQRPAFAFLAAPCASPEGRRAVAQALAASPVIGEAAVVAAETRVEVYCTVAPGADSIDEVSRVLAEAAGAGAAEAAANGYFAEGADAVGHLLAAACECDYFALKGAPAASCGYAGSRGKAAGEGTPFGSGMPAALSRARSEARAARLSGEVLDYVLARACAVGEAALGGADEQPEEARAAVVRALARRVFDHLDRRCVLVLGATTEAAAAARVLAEAGVESFAVIGGEEAGDKLARILGARRGMSEALAVALAKADIVVAADPELSRVLDKRALRQAVRERRGRASLVLDLTDEGAVDARAASIDEVYLYRTEDLGALAEAMPGLPTRASRREETLARETAALAAWLAARK